VAYTDEGVWYPDKDDLLSPLEANFATQASSVNNVFKNKLTPVAVNSEADITALRKGQIFYWTNWELTGFKIRDAGTPGYRMHKTGIVIAVRSQNGYSGGGLNPGAATIPISDQSYTYPTTPYSVKYEVTVMLRTNGITAGYIWLDLGGGYKREVRWHNYDVSGLYPVTASVERNMPIGTCQAVLTGNCDSGSLNAAQVYTVSSSLTISV
jgi:hypothetical protein